MSLAPIIHADSYLPGVMDLLRENAFDVVEVDQRKLKKRLGSIVRAKEG